MNALITAIAMPEEKYCEGERAGFIEFIACLLSDSGSPRSAGGRIDLQF